ncbi:MAG: exodeoxyribonuclease VII large subunit [Clostridiales Family XIII bacterium]|nr:exodeoxyribonuclease VII large subunit [Clostridiales Family XIII bacterium]
MAIKPIRVSQLNGYIKKVLVTDSVLSQVVVIGQISNFKHHISGHAYFSLKDDLSRINCFLPSGILNTLRFDPVDDLEVVCEGYISVYEKGGSYSLNIRKMSVEGQGSLALAFEKMKEKLAALGYFEEGRKRPIPTWTDNIAIVTSNTGAAIEDMIRIITSKNDLVNVHIFPTLVQGDGAAQMIAGRLAEINRDYPYMDIIIVGRGGGSIEDLWSFNEEIVADAIFSSKIPVISAVGHESDWTIADFVADLRAPTPTAAADIAAVNIDLLLENLDGLEYNIKDSMRKIIGYGELWLKSFGMSNLANLLNSRVSFSEHRVDSLRSEMDLNIRNRLNNYSVRVEGLKSRLDALSPLGVLSRGYSILSNENGKVISRAGELKSGDVVRARLSDGEASLVVGDSPERAGARPAQVGSSPQ